MRGELEELEEGGRDWGRAGEESDRGIGGEWERVGEGREGDRRRKRGEQKWDRTEEDSERRL